MPRIEWYPVPLNDEDLARAGEARDLHKIEIDANASEFPTDAALLGRWGGWLGLLVAFDSRLSVIGYLSVKGVFGEDWWHLSWIVVRSGYRRRGVGTWLLRTCARHAVDTACSELVTEPTTADGRAFAKANAFEERSIEGSPEAWAASPQKVLDAIGRDDTSP